MVSGTCGKENALISVKAKDLDMIMKCVTHKKVGLMSWTESLSSSWPELEYSIRVMKSNEGK